MHKQSNTVSYVVMFAFVVSVLASYFSTMLALASESEQLYRALGCLTLPLFISSVILCMVMLRQDSRERVRLT